MTHSGETSNSAQITQILHRVAAGQSGAVDQLIALVYEELHGLARRRIAVQSPGQTLDATALVHEAWIRLGARDAVQWDSRAHFFGAAARAMRFILVEQSRRRNRVKRGGDVRHEAMPTDISVPEVDSGLDFEALDQALGRFEQEYPRHARLVMLRYFGGVPMAEVAQMMGISLRTAERDWFFARSWLRCAVEGRLTDGL